MTRYEAVVKPVVDRAAGVILLALASPVLLVVAALIRRSDGGPAFFRQERVGSNGSRFTLVKFRTMPVGTAQRESAEAGDLVPTPLGEVLRRWNVDELPQLFNIVRGEMSLVGPRPAMPSQTDLLDLRVANGSDRLRPGLTGLAQVNSYDDMPAAEKARWDGVYARRVTARGDVTIMLRTVRYLAAPPPRY